MAKKELEAEISKGKLEIERLTGVLKGKNVIVSDLRHEVLAKNTLIESDTERIDNLMMELEKALGKDMMILSVEVTGQDIQDTLDGAESIMVKQLETKGLKDKFIILAVPHTISVQIEK